MQHLKYYKLLNEKYNDLNKYDMKQIDYLISYNKLKIDEIN